MNNFNANFSYTDKYKLFLQFSPKNEHLHEISVCDNTR